MPPVTVRFSYFTGIAADLFANPRLKGNWDADGRHSSDWSTHTMQTIPGPDACPAFTTTIDFDAQEVGSRFEWGVEVDGPGGTHGWAVMTEEGRLDSARRVRAFSLTAPSNGAVQQETYYL